MLFKKSKMKIQKKCTLINFFSLLLLLFWSLSLKDHPHTFFFIYLTLYFLGHFVRIRTRAVAHTFHSYKATAHWPLRYGQWAVVLRGPNRMFFIKHESCSPLCSRTNCHLSISEICEKLENKDSTKI